MKIDNRTLRNIFLGVGGCILLYWFLHETERVSGVLAVVKGIFSPFVVGAAIAFIFNVPMRFIERYLDIDKPGLKRAVAIVMTLIFLVLVVTLIFHLLIPQLESTVMTLVEQLPPFFNRVVTAAMDFIRAHPEVEEFVVENLIPKDFNWATFDWTAIDWKSIVEKVANFASTSISTIVSGAYSTIGSVAGFVVNAVISIVFALYCLGGKERLARQCRKLLYAFLPESFSDETIRIFRLTNSTFSNFISGQCLEAIILGGMFAVAMIILKMPYVALVSVIISVTALVPLVGAFVGCFLGAFFILVDNPMQAMWFVVMFLVLQQIEGNLIYPKVVGDSIGLPGMWVLLAVTVGGEIMGVGGMFVMIPIVSVLYTLLREITTRRVTARKIDGEKLKEQPPEIRSHRKERRDRRKFKRLLKMNEKNSVILKEETDESAPSGEEAGDESKKTQ